MSRLADPEPIPFPATVASSNEPMRDLYHQRFMDAFAHVKVELRVATPIWAASVLDSETGCNGKNRRLSTTWLKIKAAIERGAWHVNGEPIVFDRAGQLINGQHRLHAIVAAGVAVPIFVFRGIDPDAFATFDQGKKRTPGDVLSIVGHHNCSTLAAALAWQRKYNAGTLGLTTAEAIPNDQAVQMAGDYPELVDCVVKTVTKYRTKNLPPALASFLLYQFSLRDEELAALFFERVARGVDVSEDSHEFLLRRRLEEMSGGRDVSSIRTIAALCIITFNRMRSGEPVPKKVVWSAETSRFPTLGE